MDLQTHLIAVARQAVEYVREGNTKPRPHFVKYADDVIILAKAIHLGQTVGQQEGWDVFDLGNGTFAVRDIQAIGLARLAGVLCDDNGNIINKDHQVICLT